MAQPATRRLLTEQKALDTYARQDTLGTAVAAQIPAAIAALPKGVVWTGRGTTVGAQAPSSVALTAGRLLRVTATVTVPANSAIMVGAVIRGLAGATQPIATTGTAISVPSLVGTDAGGSPNFPVSTTSGVFAVGTSGVFSFRAVGTPAAGYDAQVPDPSQYTVTASVTTLEFTIEDLGAVGAAGTGRVPAVTL